MSEPSVSTSTASHAASEVISEVGRYAKEKNLIHDSDRVLCMVSGGADSVAMLHILHALSRSGGDAGPGTFSLGVCHVNYGRRGTASDADEDFVRRLGDELGVTVHSVRAPAGDRPNFQAWARDFRYLAARNLCQWQGYNRIAVGHNRDDRVETMLYRLLTYSGRRSLVVMPPRRGRVIRPLLFMAADRVRSYLDDVGLEHREDESNLSLEYTRNRIRQLVIPRLEEIRPDFRERLLDTLELLEDEDEVLESVTADAWREAAGGEGDVKYLRADVISLLPRATARLVVRRWLSCSRSRVRLSRRLLDAIVGLCRDTAGSARLSLAEGLQVERRYDRLVLLEDVAGPQSSKPDSVVLPVPGKAVFGDYEIEAVEAPPWSVASADPLAVTVDAARLRPPLKVRSGRRGDRFTPLGLEGSKSLQDLMVDEKVPRAERKKVPVVTSGGDIVWVCGLRMSEGFRVTPASRKLVGLKARRRSVENRI